MKNARKVTGIIAICMMTMLLSGCKTSDFVSDWEHQFETTFVDEIESEETVSEVQETTEQIISQETEIKQQQETEEVISSEEETEEKVTSSDEEEQSRESIGLTDEQLPLLQEQEKGYYFGLCSYSEKITYIEIYQILTHHAEDIRLTTTDVDSLVNVYQCVINDHPELFYLKGYTYTKHTVNNIVKYITFTGQYMYSTQEVQNRLEQIDTATTDILAEIQNETDQYVISKEIYEYLVSQTEYGESSADNQNICSVFLDHISVCNGYAKAAQYLFQQVGIPCILVNGDAGGDRHAWNIVLLDGAYYQFDATWGDPSYYDTIEGANTIPDIDYSYLNITTDQICRNHQIDQDFDMPTCLEQTDNYYIREGLYFSSFDKERIEQVLSDADAAGEKEVTIQADSVEVYQSMYDYLITQQNIFEYFKTVGTDGNYSIAYTSNDTLFTLSFWK